MINEFELVFVVIQMMIDCCLATSVKLRIYIQFKYQIYFQSIRSLYRINSVSEGIFLPSRASIHNSIGILLARDSGWQP